MGALAGPRMLRLLTVCALGRCDHGRNRGCYGPRMGGRKVADRGSLCAPLRHCPVNESEPALLHLSKWPLEGLGCQPQAMGRECTGGIS